MSRSTVGTRSPRYRTKIGTQRATKSSYSRKSAASRQNIKKAQVARVGSHQPYKRTDMRR